MVHSAICLNYKFYLDQFLHQLQTDHMDFEHILSEYKALFIELCREYDFSLKCSVTIYILVIAALAWIWLYILLVISIADNVFAIIVMFNIAVYISGCDNE